MDVFDIASDNGDRYFFSIFRQNRVASRYRYFLVMCGSDTGTDADRLWINGILLVCGKFHWGINTDTGN